MRRGASPFAERSTYSPSGAIITFHNRKHSFNGFQPWNLRGNGNQLYSALESGKQTDSPALHTERNGLGMLPLRFRWKMATGEIGHFFCDSIPVFLALNEQAGEKQGRPWCPLSSLLIPIK
jgi:hypothetical protein